MKDKKETVKGKVADVKSTYSKIFDDSKGKSDDELKMLLLKAGAKFSEVNGLFNKLMIEKGMRLNRADKLEAINTACDGQDLEDETLFNFAVKELVAVSNVSITSASGSVRAWAKANGVECFRKPRGGNGQGQSGFASKFYKVLVATPDMGMGAVDEYINTQPDRNEGSEISKNVIKHASMYRGIAKLVSDVYRNAVKA